MRPNLNVRFWRDPSVAGLEVCRLVESVHSFPDHTHDHFNVGLMEAGGCYCLGPRRESSLVPAGGIALINPGRLHNGIPPSGVRPTYTMLYVDAEWMTRAASDISGREGGTPTFKSLIVRDQELLRNLMWLARLVRGGAERLRTESAMVGYFSLLLARHGGLPGVDDAAGSGKGRGGQDAAGAAVRRATDFLREHLSENVSLEELAAVAGLSRHHLLRVFKRSTGMTPHVFHLQQRVDHARKLLLKGWPIAEAAMETGFVDQSHFSNKFKQLVGATPGQYLSR